MLKSSESLEFFDRAWVCSIVCALSAHVAVAIRLAVLQGYVVVALSIVDHFVF